MSYNGSGTFNLYTPGNPVVTGTTIASTWANNTLLDIATGLSTAITKDGQTTVTANIPMASHKFTGLSAGTTAGDSVRYEQVVGAYLPITGGTLTGNLLFTDNTYDIGASGATRPRDLFLARNAVVGGTLGVTGATTLSAALTYGGVALANSVTGTGSMVLATSPTLVTPVIGAATGTSLALTGALACDGNATLGNATSDVHTLTGQLKATTTNLRHELNSDYNGAFVLLVKNTDGTSPNGTFMQYSAVAPNGTGNQFWRAEDSSTVRGELRSNGGFANYSANNVNLSTRAVKNSITTYSEATLLKYEAFLEDVDWGTWKYNDQTHEDLNHGPTVEGVRNALKNHNLTLEEGSLIDVFDNDTLGLVTEDLKNIALASLIASNKRLRERVAAIEARI